MTQTKHSPLRADTPAAGFRTTWLAHGFEVLAAQLAARAETNADADADADFDVVVVGSGYGGAVAAAELAATVDQVTGKPTRVCVLERGREYLPGAFPSRMADLAGHVRYSNGKKSPRGVRTGLFDVRLGPDINALVASGLGGGSLINAGVMEAPSDAVFLRPGWPKNIRDDIGRLTGKIIPAAERRLGSVRERDGNWMPNVLVDPDLPSQAFTQKLGDDCFRPTRLTVALEDGTSAAGVATKKCIRCGDCVTGCNHGAKESLDVGLLVEACHRGAEIYCGATVLRLRREKEQWFLDVQHTDAQLRRRQRTAVTIRATRVVLAAGTYGSTEILLRSRGNRLGFSRRLGCGFSANGDLLNAVVDLEAVANAVADEKAAPSARKVGPTIHSMVDLRACEDPIVLQTLAVPGPLRRVLQQVVAFADGFNLLTRGDSTSHTSDDPDPCAVDEAGTARAALVVVLGHDGADGTIELVDELKPTEVDTDGGDGAVRVVWPHARDDLRLERRQKTLEDLRAQAGLGGRTLADPLWRVLPTELEFLFGNERGPLTTVHPLGGCPMGDDVHRGVVDDIGQVFVGPLNVDNDGSGDDDDAVLIEGTHPGLVVLDGSIVPTSLGINPALTITALALRAVEALIPLWNLDRRTVPANPLVTRPVFRIVPADTEPPPETPTSVELVERMGGPVRVAGVAMHAELTLEFLPRPVAALMSPDPAERWLDIDPLRSRLRLFTPEAWVTARKFPSEEPPDALAHTIVPVASGRLRLFRREASGPCRRRWRAVLPWFINRGFSDAWNVETPKDRPALRCWALLKHRVISTWRLLTLAGEVRLFEYELTLGKEIAPSTRGAASRWDGEIIKGTKRITYALRCNPWRQLMTLSLDEGPLRGAPDAPACLALDLDFLTRREIPLLRLVSQADQATALVDVGSFLLYLMRILIRVHTWSFRKPDPPVARKICRLPGYVKGLGEMPQVHEIPVGRRPGVRGNPVHIRLTHYPPGQKGAQPVLFIHGYSASGTTFAHHATPSLARTLRDAGWDPWIVDLRTSAGMPTARMPWAFEEVANQDIPLAVDFVFRATGERPIDVVAHCMGSAMLSMALLGDAPQSPAEKNEDPYWEAMRKPLPSRIRRLVMSQVTPRTRFSPANSLRAFVMRYARQYLDVDGYAFRVEGKPSFGDQLLDRLLWTLPYPPEEFIIENPFPGIGKRPWAGTRHRMDALYGRDFSLANMSPGMLEYIDDHFGPLSLETVAQTIHFARWGTLADRNGNTRFATPRRMIQRLTFPMLSVHGSDNDLADKSTLNYMERLNDQLGPHKLDYTALCIPGCGHQDSLIGVTAEELVFPKILSFLQQEKAS